MRTAKTLLLSICLFSACSLEQQGRNIADTLGLRESKQFEVGDRSKDSAPQLSGEAEYFLGRAAGSAVLQRFKPANAPKLNAYIQLVGAAVAAHSDRPELFGGYTFYILDDQQPNAFSLPGGYIFISRGLLDQLENEEQLAAVLAHEVSHVAQRDSIEFVDQKNLGDYRSLGSLALSAASCDALSAILADQLAGAVSDVVDNLLNKGYSREKEYRADRDAAIILGRAGYDSKAVQAALLRLKSIERNSSGGLFDDHPAVEDRLAALKELPIHQVSATGVQIRSARFKASIN